MVSIMSIRPSAGDVPTANGHTRGGGYATNGEDQRVRALTASRASLQRLEAPPTRQATSCPAHWCQSNEVQIRVIFVYLGLKTRTTTRVP
jgi:hypothetical protein